MCNERTATTTTCERVLLAVACVMLCFGSIAVGYNVNVKFPIIYKSSGGSYFGYTVALHRNKYGSMVLIGAPRENSTALPDFVHQSGALFQCGIPDNATSGACNEVNIFPSSSGALRNRKNSNGELLDNMWLGVSLDTQRRRPNNDIVVCGHLWKNQYYSNHLTHGACYVINSQFEPQSVKKLVPLLQRLSSYVYGQAGTSAAYSEDGSQLILGAPGFHGWTGSVVSYIVDQNDGRGKYRNPVVPYPPAGATDAGYAGYSVTSGQFFDNYDLYYAAGAPRDSGDHGRVFIFKASKLKTHEQMEIHQKKEGSQFGEYFGASVLGINLNGDQYTDLLVGAPLYSTESGGDEGRVYVYLSNGVGLQKYAELLGRGKPNSRFGTALAEAGDLNLDGFIDVAVGAPYEDGTGAVYIYHGSETGVKTVYVQVIEAAGISPKLSGFGIHISRGMDIDVNKYPDVLVGSYAASRAVLFRSQPVAWLVPRLTFGSKQINTNLTDCLFMGKELPCVNVTTCLRYTGNFLPPSLDFEYEMFVEHPSQAKLIAPRGFFALDGKDVTVNSVTMRLLNGIKKCTTHLLYIRSNIKDVFTPLQILFRYRLIPPSGGDKSFDNSFPVISPSSVVNITSAITFQTGCGLEDNCFSDLGVTAKMDGPSPGGYLTLGVVSSVSLAITVRNRGERAYLSELLIRLPSEMQSINQHFCAAANQRQNATLVCDLGNPLLDNAEVNILIKLDVSKIPTDRTELDIVLEAVTVSTDLKPEDNVLSIPLYISASADISITGLSSQEQIMYDENENVNLPVLSHTYIIRNFGPSPLQLIDIDLYIPKFLVNSDGRKPLLTLNGLEADSGRPMTIPARCNDTYLDLKKVETSEEAFEDKYLEQPSPIDKEPEALTALSKVRGSNRKRRLRRSIEKSDPETTETVQINCDNKDVECIAIQCFASPFTDLRKLAQITVVAEVNLTAIGNFLGQWYRMELVTVGQISLRDANVKQSGQNQDLTQVKTVFVRKGPPPPEELSSWVIFVSIGVGVLLLIIIIILLVRFGFFKREQRQKIKEMRSASRKERVNCGAEKKELDEIADSQE